jgi:hypothetical protein
VEDRGEVKVWYESGLLLRSESGRAMSPFPDIRNASGFVQRKRLCLWLASEAQVELDYDIARRGNRIPQCYESWLSFNETCVRDAIARITNATSKGGNRMTHPYRDGWHFEVLSLALYDDPDGPQPRHVIGVERIVQTPRKSTARAA